MFRTATDVTVRCSCTKITEINFYTYPVAETGLYYSYMCSDTRKDKIFHEDKGNSALFKGYHHFQLEAHERKACFQSRDAGKIAPASVMQVRNKTKMKGKRRKTTPKILKSKAAMQ